MLRIPEDAAERNAIRIMNPISEEISLMRTTLAASMINAIARNQKKGNLAGRLFEIGNVYMPYELPLSQYPDEKARLCVGIFGENESFYTMKGLAEKIADMENVIIYTDGACSGNPGAGGWGAILRYGDVEKEHTPRIPQPHRRNDYVHPAQRKRD